MKKNNKRLLLLVVIAGMLLKAFVSRSSRALATPSLTNIELLGKFLFFDQTLSKNSNQSCATCHDPSVGYTGPDSAINAHGAVYPGSDPSLFGNRKPPAADYAGDSGLLVHDLTSGNWFGGMFWDGRAVEPHTQILTPVHIQCCECHLTRRQRSSTRHTIRRGAISAGWSLPAA